MANNSIQLKRHLYIENYHNQLLINGTKLPAAASDSTESLVNCHEKFKSICRPKQKTIHHQLSGNKIWQRVFNKKKSFHIFYTVLVIGTFFPFHRRLLFNMSTLEVHINQSRGRVRSLGWICLVNFLLIDWEI